MSYEQRLKNMVEKGTIKPNEAKAFQESLEKLPSSVNIKRPLPFVGMAMTMVCVLILGVIIMIVSASSGSAAPEAPQNVAESLNQAHVTGDIGGAAASFMAIFLLLALSLSGILLFLVSNYNAIVGYDDEVKKTEAFVANTLQRRRDLIPELQAVVKQAMVFEESTQSTITEQRTNKSETLRAALETLRDDTKLGPMVSAVVEAYPELKTHANIQALQYELSRAETELMIARNIHSQAIGDANAQVRSVFGSLAANMAGVRERYNTMIS